MNANHSPYHMRQKRLTIRFATTLLGLTLTLASLDAHGEKSISGPITLTNLTATSGHILKTTTGELMVLYAIECDRPTSDEGRAAKARANELIRDVDVVAQRVSGVSGVTFVKITLPDGRDLGELLVSEGLATWDRSNWPDATEFDLLQSRGEEARQKRKQEAASSAQAAREAHSRRIMELEEQKVREREIEEWRTQVEKWSSLSPLERADIRGGLARRRTNLDIKARQLRIADIELRKLETIIASGEAVYEDIADKYAAASGRFGREIATEIRLEEFRQTGQSALELATLYRAEYNKQLQEALAEEQAVESEFTRIAELDRAISASPDELASTIHSPAPHPESTRGTSQGTGFVVSLENVLTCAHVVKGGTRIRILTSHSTPLEGRVVQSDDDADWAILKVSGLSSKPIPMALKPAKLGIEVFSIGYSLGQLTGRSTPIVTRGNVLSLSGINDDRRYFQMDVPTNPGSSGSPIITPQGQWIGMITHKMSSLFGITALGDVPQGFNFALSASTISTALKAKSSIALHTNPEGSKQSFEQVVEDWQESVVQIYVD